MFWNYIIISFRKFKRQKFYSLLNIFGLATGMATVLLIMLYVLDELSFDRFHKNTVDLYRVVENQYYDDQDVFPVAVTPYALASSLKENYPEIELATRANFVWGNFKYAETEIEEGGLFVDPDFLKMFSFEFKSGNDSTALKEINSVVITEEFAKQLFGKDDAFGKIIRFSGDKELVVTGVLHNPPTNSHISFSFLLPMEFKLAQDPKLRNDWESNTLYTYVKLVSGTSTSKINDKIKKHLEINSESTSVELYLQPVSDIHLGDVNFIAEVSGKGNKQYVVIFTIAAVFILIIACINFMNLSTARAMKRAKEIGLRKTVGAHRHQLIFQFLGESVMVAFVAMAISLLMVDLLLSPFNTLIQKNLQLDFKSLNGIIPVSIAATLITGLLAGSYPAIFLSSFDAAKVLKGTIHTTASGGIFRKVLVVLQFCVSIIMISGTLIVYSQIQFIRNKNLGFEKEKIINVHRVSNNYDVFKNTLLSHGNIKGVAGTAQHPSFIENSGAGFSWPGKNPEDLLLFHYQSIDYDYVETMGMKMMMGRSFSKNNTADTLGIIINEEAMKLMNLEKPLGEVVNYNYTRKNYTIIGVVKDFHFKPIHTKIEPLILFLSQRNEFSNVMVRAEGNAEENIKMMETAWKKLNPEKSFEYSFLNEDFDNLYRAETQTGTLFQYFAVLAIIISCLGLFGLASFTVEQRSKEFGIRKVFGASISKLYYIASRDFILLVIISCFISIPVAWFWMKQWLSGFAYRIELSAGVFVIAGLAAIFIALLTVSYQALKVGNINPARAMSNE